MTISLILTAFLFDFPIMQYQTYNQDGAMKGGEGIVYEKEQYSELSVTLTEEYITETILQNSAFLKIRIIWGTMETTHFGLVVAYWNDVVPKEKLLK